MSDGNPYLQLRLDRSRGSPTTASPSARWLLRHLRVHSCRADAPKALDLLAASGRRMHHRRPGRCGCSAKPAMHVVNVAVTQGSNKAAAGRDDGMN